MTKALSSQMT